MANGCNILSKTDRWTESCCDAHDRAYSQGQFGAKIAADFVLLGCLMTRSHLNVVLRVPLALAIFGVCFTFGWLWWLKYLARRLFGWFPKQED